MTASPASPTAAPRPASVRDALRALAAHDRTTAGHARRVTDLAGRLGEALGLGEADRAALRLGAALHDLGKLAVPAAVLGKPGALSEDEFASVRAHPTAGVPLARAAGVTDRAVLDVIEHHHERWDGRGYGAGLSGEAIPLLARIVAVADVYDALTSARAYKAPWTPEAALALLRDEAGKAFDPAVVAAFARLHTAAERAA